MSILVVDGDRANARAYQRILRGAKVQLATNEEDAIRAASSGRFDLVICDLELLEFNYEKFLTFLGDAQTCPRIYTGRACALEEHKAYNACEARRAQHIIAIDNGYVLLKPFNAAQIRQAVGQKMSRLEAA